MITPGVLRRKDLALEFGVDVRTVDRWRVEKILPAAKWVGGRPFWRPDQIDKATRTQIKKWNTSQITRARKAVKLKRRKINAKPAKAKPTAVQLAFKF